MTGHAHRVLYLAAAPDRRSIVTGAGDESVRFWSVFNQRPQKKEEAQGLSRVNPSLSDVR